MPQIALEPTLALNPEGIKSTEKALALYESALNHRTPRLTRALKASWAVFGLAAMIYLAWNEPFSVPFFAGLGQAGWPAWSIDFLLAPLVMALRGILLVESFGYVYHRWFQHLGFFTRCAQVFRRNQRFHWMHHMILYPIGRFYQRGVPYISSEQGIAWSWVAPGILSGALALYLFGPTVKMLSFSVVIAAYATFVIDDVHSRFHLARHSYQGSRYFKWLEDIHVLHHWDQRANFTIVHPAMDWLFGTYLAPRRHQAEIKTAIEDIDLTVSDLVNWRYLLVEATPAEYAAFISQARRHRRSLRKIGHLMEVLHHRLLRFPEDLQARDLRQRAVDLMELVERG